METPDMTSLRAVRAIVATLLASAAAGAWAEGGTVYRCPGPPILYTDTISAQEAKAKGCHTIEGAPITVMKMPKPAPIASPGPRSSEARVNQDEQRQRDNDARQILQAELQKEQDSLAALQKEYNNGQPERLGSEHNYAKYQERVASLQAAISRKQADIESIKREMAKLPQ
jgi:hypothetical protein